MPGGGAASVRLSTRVIHGPPRSTTKRASTLRLPAALVERDCVTIGERRDGGDGAAIEDIGAAGARIEKDRERQPRIVGQAVAIVQNRGQPFLAEPRQLSDVIVIEPAACRQAIAEGECVVERKTRPEHQSLPPLPAIDRAGEILWA